MDGNKMTDKEKLLELLYQAYRYSLDKCLELANCAVCPQRKYGAKCRTEYEVEYLLSHGVTFEKQGEWIHHECYDECSNCKAKVRLRYNYCPNCGARMKGEKT